MEPVDIGRAIQDAAATFMQAQNAALEAVLASDLARVLRVEYLPYENLPPPGGGNCGWKRVIRVQFSDGSHQDVVCKYLNSLHSVETMPRIAPPTSSPA